MIGRKAITCGLVVLICAAAGSAAVEIPWFSVDSGAAQTSIGGAYALRGAVGQPDAAPGSVPLAGGTYELVGGFFAVAAGGEAGIGGDVDGDGDVDLNDFLTFTVCFTGSGLTVRPEACTPPEFSTSDIDGDGDVDLNDFLTFSTNFTGSL